ncbi:MAG: BT4734/BF3469 family protein [Prevotellaceae bacterium]|nr:BT4734/BF3469 family protein [Prevotellaceae bacterium]
MFGISQSVKSRVVDTCTPDLFSKAVDSPLVASICAELEDALEKVRRGDMSRDDYDEYKTEKKKLLPVFTPHATFVNGMRNNKEAMPSGLSMYDVDHITDPKGYYEKRIKGIEELLGVVLAHVTPSGEGLRLFFIMPNGMDLEKAQRWMSVQLADKDYDQCVKDLARCSFAVPRSYILYIDTERLFRTPKPEDMPVAETESHDRREDNAAKTQASATVEDTGEATETIGDSSIADDGREYTFKGIPYRKIIKCWFDITGGEPEKGERNTRLHILASHLRYITDNDEDLIRKIIPRYGLDEKEINALVHSACESRLYSKSRQMNEAVAIAKDTRISQEQTRPPEMPKKLPPLIELLLSRTPDIYKPAVAHAVFPPLAAHLHRVKFLYIDNEEHEATLMNVLMAGTGAGKNCITKPINLIMADIKARDRENLRREREWKEEVNTKGSNKDKSKRPQGLVIQCIDADMTNPAFVMRTSESDGHFLYTKLNEIDQFDALKGSCKGNQQFQIMCLAFDPDNEYGQTRVGAQSITEKVQIRFNWNASTTIDKGKRYFSKVLTDGPVSRINFCTIPEQEIGADMPIYRRYDERFSKLLKPYIDNLCNASGRVWCQDAFELAKKLKAECAEVSRLSQNRVYENFTFRALVIAWLKACVLYVANGESWDSTFDEFIRWSLNYDLWCKMEFFGDALDKEMKKSSAESKSPKGPRNLLEMLPDTFTESDAIRVRQSAGMNREGTLNMLRQWRYRKYIDHRSDGSYIKTKNLTEQTGNP